MFGESSLINAFLMPDQASLSADRFGMTVKWTLYTDTAYIEMGPHMQSDYFIQVKGERV